MDYKNEILKVEKKQFELYFCDAYIKTLHPSEASYYKKHLITWRKVKHLIIKKKFALLEESAACANIYKEFWRNFFDVAKEQKTPLEYLFLSTEINNCLRRQKLVYIEDLLSQYNTIDDLLKIRKIGEKAAKDIINKLNEFTSIDKKTIDKQIMENNEDCYVLYEERDLMCLRAPLAAMFL